MISLYLWKEINVPIEIFEQVKWYVIKVEQGKECHESSDKRIFQRNQGDFDCKEELIMEYGWSDKIVVAFDLDLMYKLRVRSVDISLVE